MTELLAQRIAPGAAVRLDESATDATGGLDKDAGAEQLAALGAELRELQELMWGAQSHAMLAVLQGRDAAGKDGVINYVFGAINPQGLDVTAFKEPTEEEAAHDFLWRIHAAAPRKGVVGVANRSQYEQVLVVRVHHLAPADQIEAAYDQINHYERLLTATGTIIVKCYLHLGRDEQRKRLLARETDAVKAWKLNPGDWAERAYWDAYTEAYEKALSRCSPEYAPWFVVPADHKWAARLAVAQVVVAALRPYRAGWEAQMQALQKKMLAELQDVERR
jgi:PPK2 family polyphosphate:nucleotide phosphotransferase